MAQVGTIAGSTVSGVAAQLSAYVPRLALDWIRDAPEERWRRIDGTLVFVDVSGFTRMSERLAALGREGAEEVNGVMNGTFAALLDVAYRYGGGLLKFGGDALLLFYDGEDHAGRAATAAFRMRTLLRRVGRPVTAAGRVTLKMHVGVHSGAFDFFLVGGSHRELVVTGPPATRTVAMEAAAAAGEILLSAETASLVPARVLGEERGGGRLLKADPKAARVEAPLPDVAERELARLVPAPVRELVGAGPVEAEHRHACVAFVHFGGTDALVEADPVAAAEALDGVVRAVQDAADEHGVCFLETDVDADGGKIVLVAGAPEASENDEERMLRTLRGAFDARPPLPLRAGVHQGRVFAGEVGAPFRRTYTILGETAALAARLMSRAKAPQVLATAAVVDRSRTAFAVEPLAPFVPKGTSAPVVPLAVGAVAGSTQRADPVRLPLVGRTRELTILTAALGPAKLGYGTLVELVGDAGIGKSRLLAEVRGHAEGMAVLRGVCEQYEAATPYFAFRELLREVVGVPLAGSPEHVSRTLRDRLSRDAPELVPWIPLLAIPLDVAVASTREVDELQPAFRRARLHGAVETLLERVVDGPAMLLFEDVHWMDEASSELLRHLATQLATHPWFVCATRRPVADGFSAAEGTPPVAALTIRLEPLAPDDAKALVLVAGEDVDEEEADAIAARAGGNPLFLHELVAARGDRAEATELPETVEAVVTSRIDRLAASDRALLRWASVLGQAFPGELIAAVVEGESAAGDSDAWNRLVEFVERDPDVPGGFRFRHALIRDAAYEGLSFRRRVELHARAAEAYQGLGVDQPEARSLHAFRGERWEDAWRTSLVAGERAKAKFANVEAAEFFGRALEAARRLPDVPAEERARVWELRGDVCELAGLYAEAVEAYRAARRAAPSPRPPRAPSGTTA